ncbi:unnamed protein product [Gadus morhua 'NCC']
MKTINITPVLDVFLRNLCHRQLAVQVASEDSSYMPARILVLGATNPNNINAELTQNGQYERRWPIVFLKRPLWLLAPYSGEVPPRRGAVVLLENMTRFWSIIQIRIRGAAGETSSLSSRIPRWATLAQEPQDHGGSLCDQRSSLWLPDLPVLTAPRPTPAVHGLLKDRSQLLLLFNSVKLLRVCKRGLRAQVETARDATGCQRASPGCWCREYAGGAARRSAASPSERRDGTGRCVRLAGRWVRQLRVHLLVHVDTGHVEEVKRRGQDQWRSPPLTVTLDDGGLVDFVCQRGPTVGIQRDRTRLVTEKTGKSGYCKTDCEMFQGDGKDGKNKDPEGGSGSSSCLLNRSCFVAPLPGSTARNEEQAAWRASPLLAGGMVGGSSSGNQQTAFALRRRCGTGFSFRPVQAVDASGPCTVESHPRQEWCT